MKESRPVVLRPGHLPTFPTVRDSILAAELPAPGPDESAPAAAATAASAQPAVPPWSTHVRNDRVVQHLHAQTAASRLLLGVHGVASRTLLVNLDGIAAGLASHAGTTCAPFDKHAPNFRKALWAQRCWTEVGPLWYWTADSLPLPDRMELDDALAWPRVRATTVNSTQLGTQ